MHVREAPLKKLVGLKRLKRKAEKPFANVYRQLHDATNCTCRERRKQEKSENRTVTSLAEQVAFKMIGPAID